MKKRIRTQPSNPFYSSEPAVAKGLMADKALVQNSSLGSKTPKMIDTKPGKLSGIAGFSDKHRPKKQGIKPKPPVFGQKSKQPAQMKIKPSSVPKSSNFNKIKSIKRM
jgi:hypothetical protein